MGFKRIKQRIRAGIQKTLGTYELQHTQNTLRCIQNILQHTQNMQCVEYMLKHMNVSDSVKNDIALAAFPHLEA